jgi:hypothetical protein
MPCTGAASGTHTKILFNTVPKLVAYYIGVPYIDVRRLQGHVVAEQQEGGYAEVNASAPSWLRGGISRVEAEEVLAGGTCLRWCPGIGCSLMHTHTLSLSVSLSLVHSLVHSLLCMHACVWLFVHVSHSPTI